MRIELYCAMCGRVKDVEAEPSKDGILDVAQATKDAGWLSQTNGENFDVYCSKKCAE